MKRVSLATSSETLQTNFSQYDFCSGEGVNLSPPHVFFLSGTKINEKDTEREHHFLSSFGIPEILSTEDQRQLSVENLYSNLQ